MDSKCYCPTLQGSHDVLPDFCCAGVTAYLQVLCFAFRVKAQAAQVSTILPFASQIGKQPPASHFHVAVTLLSARQGTLANRGRPHSQICVKSPGSTRNATCVRLPSLHTQVHRYLDSLPTGVVPPNDVPFVVIGSNDIGAIF